MAKRAIKTIYAGIGLRHFGSWASSSRSFSARWFWEAACFSGRSYL
jgi:hypothetical protein